MSSSDRRAFLLLLLAGGLAACGFTPAYGPAGAATGLVGRIRADDPGDKRAFDFVERIEERLGRPQKAVYQLRYAISTSQTGVGITASDVITRYRLTGRIDWTLADRDSGERLAGGQVTSFTSYVATGSAVAGLSAEEDASTRLMRLLADQIVTRLLAAAADLPAQPG
jgi:LPS-assembly lipoprotein